jgi:hypothetical protein
MTKYNKNFQPNAVQKQFQANESGIKLKRKRNKPEYMAKHNLSYSDIANMFGYSSANSFYNASRRKDIMNGVKQLIKHIEEQLIKDLNR